MQWPVKASNLVLYSYSMSLVVFNWFTFHTQYVWNYSPIGSIARRGIAPLIKAGWKIKNSNVGKNLPIRDENSYICIIKVAKYTYWNPKWLLLKKWIIELKFLGMLLIPFLIIVKIEIFNFIINLLRIRARW